MASQKSLYRVHSNWSMKYVLATSVMNAKSKYIERTKEELGDTFGEIDTKVTHVELVAEHGALIIT
jgi:hypothetical protein